MNKRTSFAETEASNLGSENKALGTTSGTSTNSSAPSTTTNWEALIESARDGCDVALAEVFDRLHDYLLLMGNKEIGCHVQSKFGASDICQMSLMEARDSIGTFSGSSEAEIRSWLKRIMMHNLLDESRRYTQTQIRSVERETPIEQFEFPLQDSNQPNPVHALVQRESDETLRRLIEQLPPRQQRVIQLKHQHGFTLAEIAKEMQTSEYQIRKLSAAARTQLSNWLDAET